MDYFDTFDMCPQCEEYYDEYEAFSPRFAGIRTNDFYFEISTVTNDALDLEKLIDEF